MTDTVQMIMRPSMQVALLLLLGSTMAGADTILLKSGVTIVGEIVEKREALEGSVYVIRDKDNIIIEVSGDRIEKISVTTEGVDKPTYPRGPLVPPTPRGKKGSPGLIAGIVVAGGTAGVLFSIDKTTEKRAAVISAAAGLLTGLIVQSAHTESQKSKGRQVSMMRLPTMRLHPDRRLQMQVLRVSW